MLAAIPTTSTSSGVVSPTNSSPSGPASPDRDGLSTGAKAGVGVGIVAFVLVAGIVGSLLFIRHKRKATSVRHGVHELGSSGPVEKYAQDNRQELSAQAEPAALYTSPT